MIYLYILLGIIVSIPASAINVGLSNYVMHDEFYIPPKINLGQLVLMLGLCCTLPLWLTIAFIKFIFTSHTWDIVVWESAKSKAERGVVKTSFWAHFINKLTAK